MSALFKPSPSLQKRQRWLTAFLLGLWVTASFGLPYWARELSVEVGGWPFHHWVAAQGALLVFLIIVAIYAGLMNRWEAQEMAELETPEKEPHPV